MLNGKKIIQSEENHVIKILKRNNKKIHDFFLAFQVFSSQFFNFLLKIFDPEVN